MSNSLAVTTMKVVFFYRKRYRGVFSIEWVFDYLQALMPSDITTVRKEMRFVSTGFLRRLYISIDAAFHQGDVNHVTGDIHFITLFLRGRTTILTIHDLGFLDHPNKFSRYILKLFWITLPIRKCAAIHVVSEATKTNLLKHVPDKFRAKVSVIYNPVKPNFHSKEKAFNVVEPTILQIGTKQNKNLSRLAKALVGIKCKLVIVGKLSEQLISEFAECNIRYEAFSELDDTEMLRLYQMADIVSFISTLEGFGLPIIEANAVGRVVVTSNLSSMPEIAADAAHLVNPYDIGSIRYGFLKVISESTYREQLILNGFENVKRFDARKIALEYANLYNSVALRNK